MKKTAKPHHRHMQTIPLFGDTRQETSDVEFVRANLAAYPAQAKAFVALNGRALLPITGHFTMLNNDVLIMNVGATICPDCKANCKTKTPHQVIAEVIGQTALSIIESGTTPNSFNDLMDGILAGIHDAIHHLGIQSREEAMRIVDNITRTLTKDVNACWDDNKQPNMTH